MPGTKYCSENNTWYLVGVNNSKQQVPGTSTDYTLIICVDEMSPMKLNFTYKYMD